MTPNKIYDLVSTYGYKLQNRKQSYENNLTKTILRKQSYENNLTPRLHYIKLHSLFYYLNYMQPKSIIEFGSGYTTHVLSQYQKLNECSITLIDEDEFYGTRSLLSSGVKAELYICNSICMNTNKQVEIFYDYIPDRSYDLVIIDGPNFLVQGIKHTEAVSTQIIRNFKEVGFPRNILVDGRDRTAVSISEELNYNLKHTDLRKNLKLTDFNYWNNLTLN